MNPHEFDPQFETLLNYLKRNRGFDFTGYKRPSLGRRIRKRMEAVKIDSYSDYMDYLEVHPEEFALLFDTILINVTTFFRDPSAWEYIGQEILPQIIAAKKPNEPIRIWSPGCASGEEAYTVAILLAEALGMDTYREWVKIYASDIDEEALLQARQAVYGQRAVADIPPHLLSKYFEQSGSRYVLNKDLRRSVIFGRLDLVQDAPISRLDLLICRNVLMYFNAETQERILSRFHFAVNDNGFLFMGKAEMLFTHSNLFLPVDVKRRVFIKVPQASSPERIWNIGSGDGEENSNHWSRRIRFRESAFEASPIAQMVVDFNGFLVLANELARSILGLNPSDLNRPLQDLEITYRIGDLRTYLKQTYVERRPVQIKEASWETTSGEVHTFEVQITPLLDNSKSPLGAILTFSDISLYKRLQEQVEHAHQELETAYEELQSTNEELETTNEELQSTVEEMETTNEELQSANEELETMNEELQATNEELRAINEELRSRTEEINHINAYLDSILNSMRGGVVVVDREFQIQIWSPKAEDLWGLRADEAEGRNLMSLDIGLPVEQLKQPMRTCLTPDDERLYCEIVLDATNRRGKSIQCKVTCTPLFSGLDKIVRGVILLMEEVDHQQT